MEDTLIAYAFTCLDGEVEMNTAGISVATKHFVEGVMNALMENEITAEEAVGEIMYLCELLDPDR